MRTCLLMAVLVFSLPALGAEQQDVEWAEQNFAAAFDSLFPLPGDDGTFIAARHYEDLSHSTREFSVVITYTFRTAESELVCREAAAPGLFDQLVVLRAAKRTAPLSELLKGIRVEEVRYRSSSCPAVQQAVGQFSDLLFRGPDVGSIVLHPLVYEFKVQGSGGMELTTFDPTNPLVEWVERLRANVQTCGEHPAN